MSRCCKRGEKNGKGPKEGRERDGGRDGGVKDGFPGGSVSLYWSVSSSLIVSLPWL